MYLHIYYLSFTTHNKYIMINISNISKIEQEKCYFNLKKAAKVHKKTRKYLRKQIRPNMKLIDMCKLVEDKIKVLTNFDANNPLEKGMAFPVGLNVNNVAAHWSPNPMDMNVKLGRNDLIKIDFGVHYNGYIIDSAFSYSLNDKFDDLINISKVATYTGCKLFGEDARINEISKEIQEVIESYSVNIDDNQRNIKSIRSLTGHQIKRYKIHAGKVIPNIDYPLNIDKIKEGELYAIETYPSTGSGLVRNDYKNVSHYKLKDEYYKNTSILQLNKDERLLYNIICKNFGTLPFCRRWIKEHNLKRYQIPLFSMVKKGMIKEYPPLYEINNSYVAQTEHTLMIYKGNKHIFSKCDDY